MRYGLHTGRGLRRHIGGALTVLCAILLVALPGCSTKHFKKSADKEVYKIIKQTSPAVPNMDTNFTIEYESLPSLEGTQKVAAADEFLGGQAHVEVGAHIVSVEKALELAVKHNRSYQDNKESLYLQALSLTEHRHDYRPIFGGALGGSYNRSTRDEEKMTTEAKMARDAPLVVNTVGTLVGTPGDLLSRYETLVEQAVEATDADATTTEIVDERSVRGDADFNVELLLKGGALLTLDLTSQFLRYVTGDPRIDNSSALHLGLSRPLLRGAGSKIAAENLTQAERDVLYALRDFTRYRKEFTVRIASQYYSVLQSRDVARNNWRKYQDFKRDAARQRALAAEGRVAEADLGRLVQAELDAEDTWTSAVSSYREALDAFKIELGLSTDAPIVLDDQELEQLRIQHPTISADDAVEVALATRLDLYTARDEEEDAQRKLKVAANSLWPDLDLSIDAYAESKDDNRFQELDFKRWYGSAGLDLGLPLDRKSERNAYRQALISHDRASRQLDLREDNIKLEVRAAWRALDQAKRTFEIRELGVALNERRVEEEQLRADLGRSQDAQDFVDALNDLTDARNTLTRALVAHVIARLELWRDMGILFIKEGGQWERITDVVD